LRNDDRVLQLSIGLTPLEAGIKAIVAQINKYEFMKQVKTQQASTGILMSITTELI
jgi:hypothetical protein